MKNWEYKTITIPISIWSGKIDIELVDKTLNQLGQQGWELVSNQNLSANGNFVIYYTFKRGI